MKFKLDENLGRTVGAQFEAAGHDVTTVPEENLSSASDDRVLEASKREGRCLVTLDLEFGNPLRYQSSEHAGIAVLRLPPKASREHLNMAVQTLIRGLQPSIERHVWIVEVGRIRVHEHPDEDLPGG